MENVSRNGGISDMTGISIRRICHVMNRLREGQRIQNPLTFRKESKMNSPVNILLDF